jgi:hypothetical protein
MKYLFSLVLITVVAWALSSLSPDKKKSFHTQEELAYYMSLTTDLPVDTNTYFATSGVCGGCHGYDPLGLSMVDANGIDINVTDDWRATMMANSAKDPFWRAKVAHEVITYPGKQLAIEDKCTSCHAPAGHFSAKMLGATHYSMQQLLNNDVHGLDGVNCLACHMQKPDSLGFFFSGGLQFDTNRTVYGPYLNPFAGPMAQFIQFNVEHGAHINSSGVCASCHTLVTQTIDFSGNFTGDYFVEQATYHEWKNSQYPGMNKSCQSCHVPRTEDNIIIAANYAFLPPRRPYGKHHFMGANTTMLKILKNNIDTLDIRATPVQFDSSIARTARWLTEHSVEMDWDASKYVTINGENYNVLKVWIKNIAGHKVPSGYPARRMFIRLDHQGLGNFNSGIWDIDFRLRAPGVPYEMHYDTIWQSGQTQIYEMVMGDVNNAETTVLMRAKTPLKDNRIPPQGFSTTHSAYDSTLIAGNALSDPNFNKNNGQQGTGTDTVYYMIKDGCVACPGTVTYLGLYYQSIPPEWLDEMLAVQDSTIDFFDHVFTTSPSPPFAMKEFVIYGSGVNEQEKSLVKVFPNPVMGPSVRIESEVDILGYRLISPEGRELRYGLYSEGEGIEIPYTKGQYTLILHTANGQIVQKIVRL